MSSPEVQVLVVVQEALLAGAISRALGDAGFTVHWAAHGDDALQMARRRPYAAFVIELVLPDMLGQQLIHSLRAWGRCAPVLLLGGREAAFTGDETVFALAKPFVIADLVHHVKEVTRPAAALHAVVATPAPDIPGPPIPAPIAPHAAAECLVYQRLQVDPDKRSASREGRSIPLTEREFALLDCLMRHPEEVVTRAEISRAVWGSEENARSNVLEVYMNFLRRKIDQGFERKLLHTVRGVGYKLSAQS